MFAAHAVIARSLAGMITRQACTIASAVVPTTHAGTTSTAIAAAVAATTTVAATATATFGICGTHRRYIGR